MREQRRTYGDGTRVMAAMRMLKAGRFTFKVCRKSYLAPLTSTNATDGAKFRQTEQNHINFVRGMHGYLR